MFKQRIFYKKNLKLILYISKADRNFANKGSFIGQFIFKNNSTFFIFVIIILSKIYGNCNNCSRRKESRDGSVFE